MKTRTTLLITLGAVLGAFGVSRTFAVGEESHLRDNVRIESIVKVSPEGATPELPIAAGKTIYFDVSLKDTSASPASLSANGYIGSGTDRPYLKLNVPLKGASSVTINGTTTSQVTDTAVAYYVGPGATGNVLRFAYTVRPGDLSDGITWAGTGTQPTFAGTLSDIQIGIKLATATGGVNVNLQSSTLQAVAGVDLSTENTTRKWPVNGYEVLVGATYVDGELVEDAEAPGFFYQGLVPVIVRTPGNVAATAFTNSTLAKQKFYVWMEQWDGAAWKYVDAQITQIKSGALSPEISQSPATLSLSDTFSTAALRVNGVTNAAADAFTQQVYFVNIPATVAAATKMRFCYGIRRDEATYPSLFASTEVDVVENPIISKSSTSGYMVSCGEMTKKETMTLPGAAEHTFIDTAFNGMTVSGGEINLAAGETATLAITKKNVRALSGNGTLYACIERISANDVGGGSFARYYVPMNPDSLTAYSTTLTLSDSATTGSTYYRIRVPQLDSDGSKDEPFYIQVSSSPKRETINLTVDATTGNLGTEYYTPAPAASTAAGSSSFLKYTLSVAPATATRYYTVYPVASDLKTEIPATAVFKETGKKVHEVIASYVKVQSQGASVLPGAGARYTLTVPANATSADFYVACVNDFPLSAITGTVKLTDAADAEEVQINGVIFVAKSSDSSGNITGTNDICNGYVIPTVQDRAPTITTYSVPQGNSAAGAELPFTFYITDVATDYLVAQMNYGEGEMDVVLFANDADMVAIMGATAWAKELQNIVNLYGGTLADYQETTAADGTKTYGARRKPRSALGVESITFKHAYNNSSKPAWSFTVTDSSMMSDSRSGELSLQTSQKFTFYTVNAATVPATGYIRWTDATNTWSFGETYTTSSLAKAGANDSITAQAMPYPAGTATPANYTEIDATHDSFFYKWGARNADYETLLPTGDYIYDRTLTLKRSFVSGGGEADDSSKWQDIVLEAIFSAEYLPGDAATSYTASLKKPYLYLLGDYNQDGVPDGWFLRNLGTDVGRTMVESTTSQADVSADGDALPYGGWGLGDAAYKLGASDGRLGGTANSVATAPCSLTGAPFGYKLKLRGRDEALNAADGEGNWLSIPAWVVLVHPENDDGSVTPGSINDEGEFVHSWTQIRLISHTSADAGVTVAFTANNKIPYNAAEVPVDQTGWDGWVSVVDANGHAVKATADGTYRSNTVQVQVREGDVNYEQFRYTYTKWAMEGVDPAEGALFPFTTVAESEAAMPVDASVDTWSGAVFSNTYCFIDARVPNGILLDEPFYTDRQPNGVLDPRQTSWLERFAGNNGDQDSDGIKNGAEYYFWYYASRIAWGSVFANDDGIQINAALWPAVDLRNRAENNSDARYSTIEKFSLGRRFLNDYNPDKDEAAYWTVDPATNQLRSHTEATFGKGNYWATIPAVDVLAAFDPYASPSDAGLMDVDNDGLSNAEEFAAGTNPIDCDTDDDWMPDGWEVRYGLDPLNLQGNNDAEKNPDNDFFARAIVKDYPDFHHLFKVEVALRPALNEDGSEVDPDDPNNDSPFLAREGGAYYFSYEMNRFYFITEAALTDVGSLTEAIYNNSPARIDWAAGSAYVTSWPEAEPYVVEVEGKPKIIRDYDVYKTFGFHPGTAWCASLSNTALTTIDNDKRYDFRVYNTEAFTNREEFNSGILRGAETDPTSADTNGDGVPDGWEAYVNLRPQIVSGVPDGREDKDADGLNTAQEFQGRATHLCGQDLGWPESLASEAIYDTTWVNKLFPTDPWNPDTDLDGLRDGDEGNSTYTYNPSDSSFVGGGCDPTRMDTDRDGMPDGWEFRYGMIAAEGETSSGAIGPDPTNPSDYEQDYDRDGLVQVQEYYTGFLRQLRYDLGLDAARLYKDIPGELEALDDGTFRWKKLPSVYTATTDLMNPQTAASVDYPLVATDQNGALWEPIEVNPLIQGIATTECVRRRLGVSSDTTAQTRIWAPAVSAAVSRRWASSIVFPTAQQIADYKLAATAPAGANDAAAATAAAQANGLVAALQENLKALDAAYLRLFSAVTPEVGTVYGNAFVYSDTADRERDERQFRALITRVDQTIEKLRGQTTVLQPVVAELFAANTGDTSKLWAARKQNLLKALVAAFYTDPEIGDDGTPQPANPADPIYAKMAARTVDLVGDAVFNNTDPVAYPGLDNVAWSAYEEAVIAASSPLIQEQYRDAVRGFTGGLTQDRISGRYYQAPLGVHMPLLPFETRKLAEANHFLGLPVQTETTLAVNWPKISLTEDAFMTSCPLVADTDRDGMDDYWEVFHGLNPVLGDYANAMDENFEENDRLNSFYVLDKLQAIYGRRSPDPSVKAAFNSLLPATSNPFANDDLATGKVTGYDYYTYPWLAGVPFADPDGDGLLNFEEAVNPVSGDPAHYGTDPSPLWMTDPDNTNSFVSRFYTLPNANIARQVKAGDVVVPQVMLINNGYVPYTSMGTYALDGNACLPYEINEGYDTDGDGISDLTELSSKGSFRGDPQTLRTPDRQQAAYFGGKGVMQSHITSNFGPMALTTFTLECWVKPSAENTGDVILIDRPWRFNEGSEDLGDIRHNFRLGLRRAADGTFLPFVQYTGAGTTYTDSTTVPKASPEVVSGAAIKAEEWNHIAAVYDGKRLVLILNGVENASASSSLIPANGVISLKNDGLDEVQRFTYRNAPILVGAEPAAGDASLWVPTLGHPDDPNEFADYYANAYKGFIDEVRIWNGARTAAQINEKRRSGFTQAELLALRYSAFAARRNGNGYYEASVPAYPVAIYTFNDLLAGNRVDDPDTGAISASTTPWERYPGQKLVGDNTTPGSFTYRRSGFIATRAAAAAGDTRLTLDMLPSVGELFTSFYSLTAPKNLRSTMYCENTPSADVPPQSEFVPMAHNTIDHLPLADVELRTERKFTSENTIQGSPRLTYPSGSAENLKVADSVYWSPYAAGKTVSASATYNVKTTGNPYGYRYLGVNTFDADLYTVLPAYTTRHAADLLIYGDVFAKYDSESWDSSPTTDPSTGGAGSVSEGTEWFEFATGTGDKLTDEQLSKGGAALDKIAAGQTKDSDSDRMPNWWENYYGLDPEDPTGENGPHGDSDGDFLTNYAEYLARANPEKYSTVGNGVPDYQIPIWFRRGRPTFGLLYTDNDFMEDHVEAANRSERLSVDNHDAEVDADNDGWSNWAEVRANFRSGKHSTNPNAATSISQTGSVILEMPTPALRLTVDYFGDQNVYTNATAEAKIIVQSYTARNNNSAPDATFKLPLSTNASSGNTETVSTLTHEVGSWQRGVYSGYLHLGNIVPGSLRIRFTRNRDTALGDASTSDGKDFAYFDILSKPASDGDIGELYSERDATYVDEDGNTVGNGVVEVVAGTINYRTGYYTLDFSNTSDWPLEGMTYDIDATTGVISNITPYLRTDFVGVATYAYGIVAGQSNTFTLVKPDSGYIKEGINNFFVFADLDGDGAWSNGEPAGVPDQHDVDVGFDLVNRPLHVALTEDAPPGSVRLNVRSIMDVLFAEFREYDSKSSEERNEEDLKSSIIHPITKLALNPSNFDDSLPYVLILTEYQNFASGGSTTNNSGAEVYRRSYNVQKPYLTEDEIFAALPEGLPGTLATNQYATSYRVFMVPADKAEGSIEQWSDYNIAVVKNLFGQLDRDATAMISPIGGAILHNTEISFEWTTTTQVPTFQLTITKKAVATGDEADVVVFDKTIRGVTPCARVNGDSANEQFRYRYSLPRGLGELNSSGTSLFGDGAYTYTLALKPYNLGAAVTLSGDFSVQLTDSGDMTMRECKDAEKDTSYNTQDSFYVRARVRYTGVLANNADFGGRRLRVEAHYSGSFNGDPVASNSDFLIYDAVDANGTFTDAGATDLINRTIRMAKDSVTTRTRTTVDDDGNPTTETYDAFWCTRFDTELRGLPTADPVYLMAYFDLNGNGKRDAWEPWGYATQGLDAKGGYYFDPLAVTPVNNGRDYQVEFYIQDVDTDNDKLADSWEWLKCGKPTTDFSLWCGTYTGRLSNHRDSVNGDIWTHRAADGTLALTAYGAQLFGLTPEGPADANGAVKVEGLPEDLEAAAELMDILGDETAIALAQSGFTSYGLTVKSITCTEDSLTLTWDVTAATGLDDGATWDLTAVFAGNSSTEAKYAVYGKASLGDTAWTKLGDIAVANLTAPSLSLTADQILIGSGDEAKQATFFKVILSAKTAAKTLEDSAQ